jgi:anti-sigma regulatory factor (Ser/Thr protein kinase)
VARTVVSELATNAVRHGSQIGDPVIIRAYLLDGRPIVEVWDKSDAQPVVCDPDLTAETGRGLLLMEALVHAWGSRPLVGGGKVVYAILNTEHA